MSNEPNQLCVITPKVEHRDSGSYVHVAVISLVDDTVYRIPRVEYSFAVRKQQIAHLLDLIPRGWVTIDSWNEWLDKIPALGYQADDVLIVFDKQIESAAAFFRGSRDATFSIADICRGMPI